MQNLLVLHCKKTILLFVALILSFCLALLLGSVSLNPQEVFYALMGFKTSGNHADISMQIIQFIRLPRALLAACIGAILAICGAFLQGLFRNPLADPALIGVTSGASVGASVMIVFGASWSLFETGFGMSLVSFGAFIGGLGTVLLVYRAATNGNGTSVSTMLLMGIAVAALSASITRIMEFFADNEMLRRISLWNMGGLDGADSVRVLLSIGILSVLILTIPKISLGLNTLLLGESQARHLGINVNQLKTRLIILVAAGVGIAVAMAGSIAFVGLVVPHMVRLWVGPDHRVLLPFSALGGAILLLLADTLARVVLAPAELPVGLVTALLGAPLFISLLRRRLQGLH